MALVTVTADKCHLVDLTGSPFFAMGINCSGYFDRAWKMWEVVADIPEATEVKLNEMAEQGRRLLTVIAPPPEEPPGEPDEPPPGDGVGETYIVQPGDTLGKIAKEVYGDFQLWRLIFEANQDKISDPGLIRVGMELWLPERE